MNLPASDASLEAYRLSLQQSHLWQLEPGVPPLAYRVRGLVRLRGSLDRARLDFSIQRVVARHEILRTRFPMLPAMSLPVQVIEVDPHMELTLIESDSPSNASEAERIEAAWRRVADAAQAGRLDLGAAIQMALLRLDAGEHALLLDFPAAQADERTLSNFATELRLLYQGDADLLNPEPLQYADYAEWQAELAQGSYGPAAAAFWREATPQASLHLSLGLRRRGVPAGPFGCAGVSAVLDPASTASLRRLATECTSSVESILLALWMILLERHLQRDEVLVGVRAECRGAEMDDALGAFAKTLPLVCRWSGSMTLKDCIADVSRRRDEAAGWQDYFSWELLTEDVAGAYAPHCFSYAESPAPVDCAGLSWQYRAGSSTPERFELDLACMLDADRLRVELRFDQNVYAAEAASEVLRQFEALLADGVAGSREPIESLRLVTDVDRQRLPVLWFGPTMPLYAASAFCDVFRPDSLAMPDLPALRVGDEVLSYGAMWGRVERAARGLRGRGVGPERIVGVLGGRTVETVIGILAVLRAGGAYLPLDPDYPDERIAYLLRDAGVALVLTVGGTGRMPGEVGCAVVGLDELDGDPGEAESFGVDGIASAYVIYTSGSTGRPKGVCVTQANAGHSLAARRGYYREPLRGFLMVSSFSFDSSVAGIFWTLSLGAELVLPADGVQQDVAALADLIRRGGISHVLAAPVLYRALLEELAGGAGELRVAIVAGESCSAALVARHRELLPEVALYNEYGPTEASVWSTVYRVGGEQQGDIVPIGRPIANTHVVLVDRYGEPVPVGVIGEIWIGGAGVSRGYIGRGGLTAERFVPDPFVGEGGRCYRTGDLGRYTASGDLEFVGRVDDQVKVRGYRIELGEIEARLREYRGVREAAVRVLGEGAGQRLCGYVVGVDEAPGWDGLRAHLSSRLPEYMVPPVYVALASLPLTVHGKVDRRALPEPGWQGEAYAAPGTAVERILAEVWGEVLGVERVGTRDNFFALGGDSILSIQVVSRARARGVMVTPRQLFEAQTVSGLAALAGTTGEVLVADEDTPAGEVPLTPIQQWFFEHHPTHHEYWTHSFLVRLREAPSSAALAAALDALIERHDALRARFGIIDGRWTQTIDPRPALPDVPRIRVRGAPGESTEREIERVLEPYATIDLASGALMRVVWIDRGGDDSDRLLIVVHHLVADGISWGILLEDFAEAYRQAKGGPTPGLSGVGTSFRAWCRALRAYAASPIATRELPYWLARDGSEGRDLPVDEPEGSRDERETEALTVSLPETVTRRLLAGIAGQPKLDMNTVLLTGLARVVGRWTGEEAVAVDLDGHGRDLPVDGVDVSRTVGWFTTVHPVILPVELHSTAIGALRAIKEVLRAVPHKGAHHGVLRYLSDQGEVLGNAPTPSIIFNYLGRLYRVFEEQDLFDAADAQVRVGQHPDWVRPYELAINAELSQDRLRISWEFSRARLHRSTIERIAADHLREIADLADALAVPGAIGYTPGDFPLARVEQRALDRLLGGFSGVEDVYPLTPLQQGMLFHSQYAPGSGVYVEHLSCVLRGPLDADVFRIAWRQVVERHPILRTAFLVEGLDEPLQVVLGTVDLPFDSLDWTVLPDADQRARWADYKRADLIRGFDSSKAPLMRLALVRCADDRHLFLWSHHHVLLDGWSGPLVLKDAFTCYAALSRGESPARSDHPRYADYLAWRARQDLSAAERYWRSCLGGFRAPTRIGVESGAESSDDWAERVLALDGADTVRLAEFARACGVTLNTLVQGAWALLLGRRCGERDVLFGVTVSGRPADLADVESIVGMLNNALPLRVRLPSSMTVGSWLRELQERNAEARQFEYTPLVAIQSWSELGHGEALFDSLLAFENYPMDRALREQSLGDLRVDEVVFTERTNYPLTIVVFPGAELLIRFGYVRTYIDDATLAGIVDSFRATLRGLAGDAQQALGAVSTVAVEQLEGLRALWSEPAPAEPSRGLLESFEAWAERTPDAVALVFGDERVRYRDLNTRANRLAHFLLGQGVGPGQPVALCLDRSVELVEGILAVAKCGAPYLPIDPLSPAARVGAIIADAGAEMLLSQRHLEQQVRGATVPTIWLDTDRQRWLGASEENPASRAGPEDLLYVIYTSGSTGTPKGVAVTRANVERLFTATEHSFGFTAADVWTLFHSYSFDFSVWELWGALRHGARLVVVPYWISRSPDEFYDLVLDQSVTILNQTPSAFRSLLHGQAFRARASSGLLRLVIFGGEALDRASLKPWFDRFGDTGPRLVNMYGITETTVHVTEHLESPSATDERASIIGRPLRDLRCRVLDFDAQPLPTGVAGELYVGGAGLARGYLGHPALTAERFVPDPYSADGARLYRTGDLVRFRPDGDLEYLGRIDQQIKLRGFRIEPGEIEARFVDHPEVSDAAVIARGNGADRRLVAFVVRNAALDDQGRHIDRIEQWQTVFDDAFREPSISAGEDFNIAGWVSSYTGEPVPAEQMAEWVHASIERIQLLEPRRVLEIGCGTGLLLFRLAPRCERYVGIDFSASALDHVRRVLGGLERSLPQVELLQRRADELDGIRGPFDTVILNSVIQYFPDADYLERVLRLVMPLLDPERGAVFVGDVRHLGLVHPFHVAAELHRAAPDARLGDVRLRADAAERQEDELLLDPRYFLALGRRFSAFGSVDVRPRRGRHANEMNEFRYDVVMRRRIDAPAGDCLERAWGADFASLGGFEAWLVQRPASRILVRGVPNARVERSIVATELLAELDGEETVSRLWAALSERPLEGIDPDDVALLEPRVPYRISVSWTGQPEVFDVHCVHADLVDAHGPVPDVDRATIGESSAGFASRPMRNGPDRHFVRRLREHLAGQLPDYMIPSAIVTLAALPTTVNGKLDTRALPDELALPREPEVDEAPVNPTEAVVIAVWCEVLGLDAVGRHDDFFALGGHSLIATQIVTRLRRRFGVELALRSLFEASTPAALAAVIEALLIEQIDALSDEEVLRLLEQDGAG